MNSKDATQPYRFEHFDIKVMLGDMRFARGALKPGQSLPNTTVLDSQGKPKQLYKLCEEKPLLLVTGSITCPMTISALPSLDRLLDKFSDSVNFALLYVREAHPAERFPQTQSLEQKNKNANSLRQHYGVNWPVLIDTLDGCLHRALDLKPNSAHLIGAEGEILFQSLWAGDTAALEHALQQTSEGRSVTTHISQKMLAPFLLGAGFMHNVLKHAGTGAYKELSLGAPPIALLSKTASWFAFLPKQHRGIAAASALLLVTAGLGFFLFSIF